VPMSSPLQTTFIGLTGSYDPGLADILWQEIAFTTRCERTMKKKAPGWPLSG